VKRFKRVLWIDASNPDIRNVIGSNMEDIKIILAALKRIIKTTAEMSVACLVFLWKISIFIDGKGAANALDRVRYFIWRGTIGEFTKESYEEYLD
jgi:hypothetical protein